jgi:hypothetical protein
MIKFYLGTLVGALIGVATMCCMVAAGDTDERWGWK